MSIPIVQHKEFEKFEILAGEQFVIRFLEKGAREGHSIWIPLDSYLDRKLIENYGTISDVDGNILRVGPKGRGDESNGI